MSDQINEFIIEAREHLAVIEESLLALEKQPDAVELAARVDRCFRSIHSIKGDAGFLGLQQIRDLAHAMETLLDHMREHAAQRESETLLVARDRLAVLVDDAANSHLVEIDDILARVESIVEDRGSGSVILEVDLAEWNETHPGGVGTFIRQVVAEGTVRDGNLEIDDADLCRCLPKGKVRWTAVVETPRSRDEFLEKIGLGHALVKSDKAALQIDLSQRSRNGQGLADLFTELSAEAGIESGSLTFPATDLRMALPSGPVVWTGECDRRLISEEWLQKFDFDIPPSVTSDVILSDIPGASNWRTETHPAKTIDSTKPITRATAVEVEKSSTLRIQVELLDRLMTLVGELTLVRNQSLIAFANEDGAQRAIIQRLNSVTSELQDATLRARMQPVGNLFNKFPRMVRDLARQLGKQVEIELRGREVEMDKTILEQLSDPLTHLVRNSVDHGIEMPEERVAKGKSAAGKITLSATHEDGQVHIEIADDGKGIDGEAVKAKALSLRLKTEAELERMTPRELFSLILLPGFSTAKKVTEVSGRGVGMDVVKTNIEQLEGTLNIDSVLDLGCSTVLRLPLTLAIIPCLIVSVGEDRFAVPQRELEEVVCLHPHAPGRIEQAFDTEVYRLRDRLLPIVRLSEVLARRQSFTAETKSEILATYGSDGPRTRIEYILVLKLSGRSFGLVVDEVRGTQEIVVKPLHTSMKRVGIFTGATIMGDGRVALITDSEGIVEHARLSFEATVDPTLKAASRDAAQTHRVLLFEYGPNEQFALPLLQIRRIELIDINRIERVGHHEYVMVDGVSTRILRLDQVINSSSPEANIPLSQMSLILPKFVPEPVGILVSKIVDTESLSMELQDHPEQDPGILGSAVVRGRLTLFLDMHRMAEKLFGKAADLPDFGAISTKRAKRLLLVDDTAFFREVVKRYFVAEGLEVETAVNGEAGLEQLATRPEFDLIVSDIEMPVMDGWEFAREARRRGIKIPILALTSLSGVQYESKAKECGFDGYETKLDHTRLLKKVSALLSSHGEAS
jgi:two-component system chemotaxis sensor kinase CheA